LILGSPVCFHNLNVCNPWYYWNLVK